MTKSHINKSQAYELRFVKLLKRLRSLLRVKVWMIAVCMQQREWLVNRWSCWQAAGFMDQFCAQLAGGHRPALGCLSLSLSLYLTHTLPVKTLLITAPCSCQKRKKRKKKSTTVWFMHWGSYYLTRQTIVLRSRRRYETLFWALILL